MECYIIYSYACLFLLKRLLCFMFWLLCFNWFMLKVETRLFHITNGSTVTNSDQGTISQGALLLFSMS